MLDLSMASVCVCGPPSVWGQICTSSFFAARSTYTKISLNTTEFIFVLAFSSQADTIPETTILVLKVKPHMVHPE